MTSDHDPRELREAANRWRDGFGWVAGDFRRAADYILATVRDDDGELQADFDIRIDDAVELICRFSGVSVKYRNAWAEVLIGLSNHRPTRGQFRALCRGLGIVPDAAKTV